jgi:Ca2+-binding EF-hand superfamily protein
MRIKESSKLITSNNSNLLLVFRRFDLNHNNKLEFTELKTLLQSAGLICDDNSTARLV